MPIPEPKFLQIPTQDVELNRVQNNVAEALRHLQQSITVQYQTYVTNVFTTGYPGETVSTRTMTTSDATPIAMFTWAPANNSIAAFLLQIAAWGPINRGAWTYSYVAMKNGALIPAVLNGTALGNASSGPAVATVIVGNTIQWQVTGAAAEVITWVGIMRRIGAP